VTLCVVDIVKDQNKRWQNRRRCVEEGA